MKAHVAGTGFWTLVLMGFFELGVAMLWHGQDNFVSAQARDDFKIQIRVEEVRLDAVVLDNRGRQVTDLTASDFEIRQDDRPQTITSCTYINDYRPQEAIPATTTPHVRTPMPERKDVRRIIGFVVDNLSMSFEQVYYARTALKKFVKTQMQPGDIVAIVQTAQGNAANQLFSHDKDYLLRAVDKIKWFIDARVITHIATQYMAMDYFIEAMRDMPGRKALVLMTTQIMNSSAPSFFNPRLQDWRLPASPGPMSMESALNLLADKALRAGVVIHTMDIRGLEGLSLYDGGFGAEQNLNESYVSESGEYDPSIRNQKIAETIAAYNSLPPYRLSQKTGGLTVTNTNWFFNGIGPANEALKGYYILTYIPPAHTFTSDRLKLYHRIKIKVMRTGLEVHTRDGFIGTDKSMDASFDAPPTVRDAIYSPFRNNGLDVSLAAGYVYDPQKGYLLRHFLHLAGKDLSIVERRNGSNSISVDVACITSSMDKFVNDAGNLKYEFRIKNENVPWIREHGLRFSLDLPVEKPGDYYVRAAVRDLVSGKVGSAYQYMEIPNLRKNRLSLSNIFITARDEDAPWTFVAASEKPGDLLYPDMRRDPRRSPALRSYLPGESFECAAMVYNAKRDGEKRPNLESQFILYANGKETYRSPLEAIDLSGTTDFNRIPVKKALQLANSADPGDYILMLQVKDKNAEEKHSLATQVLDFRVLTGADLRKEEKSPTAERKEIALSPNVLAQYAGMYKLGPGSNIAVTLAGGRLFVQTTGQPELPLYPESETKFFHKAIADAENEFVRDGSGIVTHMIVRRGMDATKAPRISSQVVERKEITLSDDILAKYVGTYKLSPLVDVMVTLEHGNLYSRIPGQKMFPLCPESETMFFVKTVADAENEFIKDEKGNVTHMIVRRDGEETRARRTSKKAWNGWKR